MRSETVVQAMSRLGLDERLDVRLTSLPGVAIMRVEGRSLVVVDVVYKMQEGALDPKYKDIERCLGFRGKTDLEMTQIWTWVFVRYLSEEGSTARTFGGNILAKSQEISVQRA